MSEADKIVYLGLGGNLGDRAAVLRQTLSLIAAIPQISNLEVSSFYETAPITDIPQPDYLNAVCRLRTNLHPMHLLSSLKVIETMQGKIPKPKNFPRIIDIDILFFGTEACSTHDCEIPHPRWRERLFVIAPLLEFTTTIVIPGKDQSKEIVDLLKLKDSLKEQICIKFQ